jgi:hypothetical protein
MGGSNSSNRSNNEGDATRVQIMANVDPENRLIKQKAMSYIFNLVKR